MAREGMLKELDHSKLPVLKELDPDWLNKPYDKGNKYSLPQLLGTGYRIQYQHLQRRRIHFLGRLMET